MTRVGETEMVLVVVSVEEWAARKVAEMGRALAVRTGWEMAVG